MNRLEKLALRIAKDIANSKEEFIFQTKKGADAFLNVVTKRRYDDYGSEEPKEKDDIDTNTNKWFKVWVIPKYKAYSHKEKELQKFVNKLNDNVMFQSQD